MKWLVLLFATAYQALAGQIDARFMADTPTDQQWARWHVAVDNESNMVLSAPSAALDVTVPAGKTPMVQGWDMGAMVLSITQTNSTTWRVWVKSPQDLPAGQTWNSGRGVYFGVFLSDWSNWNFNLSPVFTGSTGSWALDTMVMVWDASGKQVWGHGTVTNPQGSSSTFHVTVDSGGVCNATGSVVVQALDSFALRCTPNKGEVLNGWTLDGILKSLSIPMNLHADGLSHQVEVLFKARRIVTATISTVGSGTCQPSGQVPEYSGDTMAVSCTPAALWTLQSVVSNGKNLGALPIASIPVDTVNLSVQATFVYSPPVGLQVLAERDPQIDPHWSKVHIQVLNNGTSTIPAGYQVVYTFRIPANLTPSLSNWDVPSATTQLEQLTNGYWRVRITSTTALGPNTEGGDGRGWYFGLNVGTSVNWDVTGDIAMPSGTGWQSAPYITVYSGQTLIAGAEPSLPSQRPSLVIVTAYFKEEGNDTGAFRPRILIRNSSNQALADFYFDFYFRTEGGKLPILNPYFPDLPLPRLDALGNGNYRIRFDYTGYTLPPQSDLPDAAGSVFMLHYSDWSKWDRSNDCSFMSTNGNFEPDEGILIYDHAGNLLWGNKCAMGNVDTSSQGPTDTTSGFHMAPPVIAVQPRDTDINAGSECRFQVQATGEGTLQYQWRHNGVDIPGANNPVLDLSLIVAGMDGDGYSCAVSNAGGTTVSRTAILSVESIEGPIFINSQPSNDTVPLGGDATFSVGTGNSDGAEYQWYHGIAPIPGATSATLVVHGILAQDSAQGYWVRITSGSQQLDSRQAKLVIGLGRPTNQRLTISGRFSTDGAGSWPSDTSVDLLVRIYALPTGGDALWGEEIQGVPIQQGRWELDLGRGNAGATLAEVVSTHQGLYAEISFAGMIPATFGTRIPLTAEPYAYQAGLRMLSGSGAPTQAAPVGVFYLNQDDRRLWQRESTGWRKLDP